MDAKGQSPKQEPTLLSAKVRELIDWFLEEAAPVIDAEKYDWKVVIHSLPGGKTKTIIEKHLTM